jgi:3-mercaptopyruvate sulfurtransferase SseA
MAPNTRQPNRAFLILVIAGGLLLISAAIWLLLSNTNGGGQTASQPTSEEDVLAALPRISLEEAKTAYDQQSAVFLDVRTAEQYAQSHVPGAISIPYTDLASRMSELDPNTEIITYCT